MLLIRGLLLCALLCGATIAVAQDNDNSARAEARAAMARRIDERIEARIRLAGYSTAGQSSDEEFLRRVYLDLTGAIARIGEVREFLADERANKREVLIDHLLDSPAHATHLANTWRNILLPGGLNLE